MENTASEISKNVLIAGQPGYLETYLQGSLEKEGYSVFALTEDNITLHNPYAVFYFSDKAGEASLTADLQLAKAHHAKYFYFISQGKPQQQCFEDFVIAWGKSNNLSAMAVRLADSFGEGQQEGLLPAFFAAAIKKEKFTYTGDDSADLQLFYAQDAAFGLLTMLQRGLTEARIAIVPEEKVTFTQLVLKMNAIAPVPDIAVQPGNYAPKGEPAEQQDVYTMHLRQKYHVPDMLEQVYKSYQAELESGHGAEAEEKTKWQIFIDKFKPYLENAGLFIIVVIISYFQGKTPVNAVTGLDISYLYIIIMGIMYGKKQSMPAIIPAIGLLSWSLLNSHQEIGSLIYLPQNIFHYATYVFFGVFSGYVRDGWSSQLEGLTYKLQHLGQRYDFLNDNYQKAINIKDKLYYQIVNSDDSIGWFYSIIHQLDTVEVENIFTQAAAVTGRIMGTTDVAIYVMGKGQFYVRQKVRLGSKTQRLPHSRKVEETPYIVNMLENRHIFVNHGLTVGVPDLAAPIIYGDEIIAIIEIYGMDFDQWSIYQQNLLTVTSRLISMAIGKAYMYEEGIQDKRFLPGTRILQPEEFAKLEEGLRERAALQDNVHNLMLELGTDNLDYQELDHRLSGAIRQEDAVGLSDGKVFLLLHDTDEVGLNMVKQRLVHRGIEVKESRELI